MPKLKQRPVTEPPLEQRPIETSLVERPLDKLTRKQRLFIEYHSSGMNAYQAAIKAGYSVGSAEISKQQILSNPIVAEEVRKRRDELVRNLRIDREWVIQEAQLLASANISDFIDVLPDGNFKINLNRCTREQRIAIQEIAWDAQGRPKIKLADKKAALELLAKLLNVTEDETKLPNKLTINYLDAIINKVTVNEAKPEGAARILDGLVAD